MIEKDGLKIMMKSDMLRSGKQIIFMITAVCVLAAMTGCKQKDTSSEVVATPAVSDKEDEAAEDTEAYSLEGEVQTAPEFAQAIVTNSNQYTYTGTLEAKEDRVLQSYQLDQELGQELEQGSYTFQDPFIVLNPFGNSPLTAVVLFQTEEECPVRVTVKGHTEATDVVGNVDSETLHRVPVIGLYPGEDNTVVLQLLDEKGNVTQEKTITITTDPLPSSMEKVVEVEESAEASAYGLIEVSGFGTPYPFAFDTEGHVRWYLSETYASYGYFPLSNEHFIVMDADVMIQTYEKPHAQQLYEMDYLGRVYQIYMVENGAHHEVIEKTPGGNLLVLTNSIDEHVEDMVQEIDRKTGEIIRSLDMREIFGDTYVDMMDWAHLNTVSYNPDNDCVILSVRNVHSAIKVNWSTKELVWILGNPEVWEGTPYEDKVLQPQGDIIWNYQQHSVYEIAEDLDDNQATIQIMMFDNHWDKTRKVDFFDDLEDSYVSLFTVDEAAMTVSQLKTYAGVKSKITSNFGFDYEAGRVFFMGGYLAEETEDGKNGMIYEYDYNTGEVLNQYSLRYTFYRAYEFAPDFNTCAEPLTLADNYLKGTLRAAEVNTQAEEVPEELLPEGVGLWTIQQLLYIEAKDHQVSKVEFIGKDNSYLLDFSYTGEGEKTYHKLTYSLVVPFSNLTQGEYRLVITYDGVRYDTNETITLQ